MKKIIYVNVLGGPPFQYVLKKLNCITKVWVVQVEDIEKIELNELKKFPINLILSKDIPPSMSLISFITNLAKKIVADAIITFDEFYLEEISKVNMDLNLKGPGCSVINSLRKDIMYKFLERKNLLKRHFVASTVNKKILDEYIEYPYLIKPASCAGSLGISLIKGNEESQHLPEIIRKTHHLISKTIDKMPYKEYLKKQPLIKEGMLKGNALCWFGENSPYADYISVEGLVISGKYYPIAITQNMPMVDPFIETVSISPCTLDPYKQQLIIDKITPCIESLGLDYCGTHTEIKLLDNNEIAIIESAARFAGWSILPQIETSLNVDLITEYVNILINKTVNIKLNFNLLLKNKKKFSATINLLPVNEYAEPWDTQIQYIKYPDIQSVIHSTSTFEFTPYINKGEVIYPISKILGAWNSFGKIFLISLNEEILLKDIVSIRKNIKRLIS